VQNSPAKSTSRFAPHMRMRRDVNRSIWRQRHLVPCDRQNTRPDGPSTSRRQRSSNAQFPHLRFSLSYDFDIVVSHDPTFLSASTQRFVTIGSLAHSS